jgi:hypothetical protein
MITALACGSGTLSTSGSGGRPYRDHARLASGRRCPRKSAAERLDIRPLEVRSDSGPTGGCCVVAGLSCSMLAFPLGSMRGNSSSSPRMAASSSSETRLPGCAGPPGSLPAWPVPSPSGSPGPIGWPTSPSPARRRRAVLAVAESAAHRAAARDADQILPLRPIISPCVMYFRRFSRIFPRTICGNARRVAVDFHNHGDKECSWLVAVADG